MIKYFLLTTFCFFTHSGIKQSIATTTASISRLMKEQKECQDSERKASTERRKRLETLRTAVRIGIQDLQAFDTEINDLTDDSNLLSAEQEKIENSQQIKVSFNFFPTNAKFFFFYFSAFLILLFIY